MIDLVVVGIDMFLAVIHFYFFDIDICIFEQLLIFN